MGVRNRIRTCDFEQLERCGFTLCYLRHCIVVTPDHEEKHNYYSRCDSKALALGRKKPLNSEIEDQLGFRNYRTTQCLGSGGMYNRLVVRFYD